MRDKSMMPARNAELESINSERLIDDVRSLVEESRRSLARAVNTELVMLYWHIGRRISEELPAENRAEYGARIVELVSERLTAEYGKGFRRSNVFHMVRFAEVFDDLKIVQTLSGLLSWSHFIEIIYLKDPLQRQFYAEMARIERWSVRTLRQKVQEMLYERTAISRKPEELARQELEALQEEDRMTPDLVFRDPYLLDFLGLEDTYSERDLEAAILRELERFLLREEPPVGFIPCGEKNREQIELLQLDRGVRSGWRNTWWSCRPGRCWRPSCTRPYGWRESRWKGI